MPYKRNKELGKKAYFSNDISVSADKSAWIHKIPTSSSWYFRMWITAYERKIPTPKYQARIHDIGFARRGQKIAAS